MISFKVTHLIVWGLRCLRGCAQFPPLVRADIDLNPRDIGGYVSLRASPVGVRGELEGAVAGEVLGVAKDHVALGRGRPTLDRG